ncbi:MAG: citrate synthase [Myxococcaceae bacterium]|nr:citrate synthase [Myxococcaceae bacterium]
MFTAPFGDTSTAVTQVDQRGIDNQHQLLSAPEACALLGVKAQTLYAYVSRGLVRRVVRRGAGARAYVRDDVERLTARHKARSGHGPVAAGALRWGEPVLESALTEIGPRGPRYRGFLATALARQRVGFEAVAELLLTGRAPATPPPPWPKALPCGPVARLVPKGAPPLHCLAGVVPALLLRELGRPEPSGAAELDRARALIRTLAGALALGRAGSAGRLEEALRAPSVASAAAVALGARGQAATEAIDAVLILSADHELNASCFTARVAASAGAGLLHCVSGALQTMTGPLHGASPDRLEALLAEAGTARRIDAVVAARQRRGEAVIGFGHPLYPGGDPRGAELLALARRLSSRPRAKAVFTLVRAVERLGGPPPALDVGLVAVTAALGLPPGAAAGLFALGRSAGWLAHALEQRAQGFMLRPRARYVGPP